MSISVIFGIKSLHSAFLTHNLCITSQVSLTVCSVLKFGLKHLQPFWQIILDVDKYPIICDMKSPLFGINFQSAFYIC